MKETTKEQLLGTRLRIENTEGKPIWMTRITDAATGELIENIRRISLVLDVNDRCHPIRAWITLCFIEHDQLREEEVQHEQVELLVDVDVEQIGVESNG